MAILTDIQDPRVRNVTVTYVEVSGDLRQAKVHVSVMGNETQQQLSLRGLQHAAGFLQSKLSDRIDTRYTPRLQFLLDPGVKHSIEVAEILGRVLPKPETDELEREDADSDEPEADEHEPDEAESESAADGE